MSADPSTPFSATQNPCRLCAPFGACMVFAGIAGGIPFIHGSQGCSTYIRRYLIGHFREPVDIACSNFSESSVIFGGEDNFRTGLMNVIEQYNPMLIGIATTCLAETIGDDVRQFVCRFEKDWAHDEPILVSVSTPSYEGCHNEGFHRAVRAIVEKLARPDGRQKHINLFCGMVSPEDMRHLKDIVADFGLEMTLLPDYSDALDNGIGQTNQQTLHAGTPIDGIRRTPSAKATVEFASTRSSAASAGAYLLSRWGTPLYELPLPIGVRQNDLFFERLAVLSGNPMPDRYGRQRARLIDAYVDGHKYVFGKKALLYGPSDLVAALAVFLDEIGMTPAVCGIGEKNSGFKDILRDSLGAAYDRITVVEDTDFVYLEDRAKEKSIDMVIGNSNGFKLSCQLGVPLVRIGLPVHDRLGAARIATLGYAGTLQLYDRIVNAFLRVKQESSPVGYTHL